MKQGLFISFEGIDGSGKTTQIGLLRDRLEQEGYPVLTVREPGGTPISETIRELLLDVRNDGIGFRTEAFLYAAARAQLVMEIIRPALAGGKIVIADRYQDSTLAYQGYGRGLELTFLEELNQLATTGIVPDLTLLLDITPHEGLLRRGNNRPDRLEQEGLSFQAAVRKGYLELSQQHSQRIKVVNASLPVDQVQAQIIQLVLPHLVN